MTPLFRVAGDVRVPGDKSITHRALLLAAAAAGDTRLRGLLAAGDTRSTARVLRQLGCPLPELPADGGDLRFRSAGLAAWRSPDEALDCGNSGTTARLLLGLLAGRPLVATLTGDASLLGRPMRRVSEPLVRMGAAIREIGEPDRLPLQIAGGKLRRAEHRSAAASAQVKSALLLAGVSGGVAVTVWEPFRSRDHTERMLVALGVSVPSVPAEGGGWLVELQPPAGALPPLDLQVPGDVSSAAFLVALAALGEAGELRIRGVGVNPTRTGFLEVVRRMGGVAVCADERDEGGEPVADLLVRAGGTLRGVTISETEVPSLIDELPLVGVLAARAEGETRVSGAGELRVKESDRVAALVAGLRAVGADAEELPDGFVVRGADRPLRGRVETRGDHRLAMAFGVLGTVPGNQIVVDEPEAAEVSFPGFWTLLASLAEPFRSAPAAAHSGAEAYPARRIVIAIDGPAGSGKSSTARAAAARLGYRHLDSGAFYRALTWAALQAGIPPEEWEGLASADLRGFDVAAYLGEGTFQVTVAGREVGAEIRTAEVNAHVSGMAAVPAVREWLLDALRAAGAGGGLVADGRDIGTVVFPNAELKVFLDCAPDERARRRLAEQGGPDPAGAEVRAEAERLGARDSLDSGRAVAPLRRAPDAVALDTTALRFAEVVERIVRLARERAAGVDRSGGEV